MEVRSSDAALINLKKPGVVYNVTKDQTKHKQFYKNVSSTNQKFKRLTNQNLPSAFSSAGDFIS